MSDTCSKETEPDPDAVEGSSTPRRKRPLSESEDSCQSSLTLPIPPKSASDHEVESPPVAPVGEPEETKTLAIAASTEKSPSPDEKSKRARGTGPSKRKKQKKCESPDFHSAYFAKMPDVEPGQPGYITRESMVQISGHIDAGFYSINSAMEMLKHAQLELFQAKNSLERLYKGQHGCDAEHFSSTPTTNLNALNFESMLNPHVDQKGSSSSISVETGETFSFQIDPWQLLNCDGSPGMVLNQSEGKNFREPSRRGRGGRRGRGSRRGGFGRPRSKEYSSYNCEKAKRSTGKAVKQFSEWLGDYSNRLSVNSRKLVTTLNGQSLIILEDLKTVLNSVKDTGASTYLVSEVEAEMVKRRRIGRKKNPEEADADVKMEPDCEDVSKANADLNCGNPKEPESANKNSLVAATDKGELPPEPVPVGVPSGLPSWKEFRVKESIMKRIWKEVDENLAEIARKDREEKARKDKANEEAGKKVQANWEIASVTDTNPSMSPTSDLHDEMEIDQDDKAPAPSKSTAGPVIEESKTSSILLDQVVKKEKQAETGEKRDKPDGGDAHLCKDVAPGSSHGSNGRADKTSKRIINSKILNESDGDSCESDDMFSPVKVKKDSNPIGKPQDGP